MHRNSIELRKWFPPTRGGDARTQGAKDPGACMSGDKRTLDWSPNVRPPGAQVFQNPGAQVSWDPGAQVSGDPRTLEPKRPGTIGSWDLRTQGQEQRTRTKELGQRNPNKGNRTKEPEQRFPGLMRATIPGTKPGENSCDYVGQPFREKRKGKEPKQRFPGLTPAKLPRTKAGTNLERKGKEEKERKAKEPVQRCPGPTRITIPGTYTGKNTHD